MVTPSIDNSVAVCGMSWLTPLGSDLEEVWMAILNRRAAFRKIQSAYTLRNVLAATVAVPEYSNAATDRLSTLTTVTLLRAFQSANVNPKDSNVVTVIGTSLGDLLDRRPENSYTFEDWRSNVATALGLQRKPLIVSTACSSGSDAIALGFILIRSGVANTVVCGGVDILTDAKRFNHSSLGTLSPTRLRAFDVTHDGTLLGEGSAFLVLKKRNDFDAAPLGFVLGCGAANDAATTTAPDLLGSGAKLAIQRAIADAGLVPEDIACYCAHGSGTALNDLSESAALISAFPRSRPKVFATKANLGHSLGATGAIECIALLMALRTGVIPPLTGTENVIEQMANLVSTFAPIRFHGSFGATLTLGFGGYDTCLILGGPSCIR